MKTYEYEIDTFIGEDRRVRKVFTDYSTNKYIIKKETGQGATTAVLEYPTRAVILIAPLVSIVQGKKAASKNIRKHKIYFAQAGNNGHIDHLQQLIMTPDTPQVYVSTADLLYVDIIKGKIDLGQLSQIPIFIDESHHSVIASNYRPALSHLTDIIFNNWQASITLSSATPINDYLEIPKSKREDFEYIYIKKKNSPTKTMDVIPDVPEAYMSRILSNQSKGEKTVVFTNDINTIHRIVSTVGHHRVQCLVGKKLLSKLPQVMPVTDDDIRRIENSEIDHTKDILICSGSFYVGFDIEYDAHVMIFARQHSDVDCTSTKEIKQADGRVRGKNLSSTLVYSGQKKDVYYPQIKEGVDNYCAVNYKIINQAERDNTFNLAYLKKQLGNSGYKLNIVDEDFQLEKISVKKLSFQNKVLQLLNQEEHILNYMFSKVLPMLSLSSRQGYSFRFVSEFAVALTLKKYSTNPFIRDVISGIQTKDRVDANRVLNKLFLFFYINDPNLQKVLNPRYKPQEKELKIAKKRGAKLRNGLSGCVVEGENMKVLSLIAESYKTLITDAMHIIVYDHCIRTLNFKEIKPTGEDKLLAELKESIISIGSKKIKDVTKESLFARREEFNNTTFTNTLNKAKRHSTRMRYKVEEILQELRSAETPELAWDIWKNLESSVKRKKEQLKSNLHFQLSKLVGAYPEGFKVSIRDFREYNPSTKCPRYLRYDYSPYKLYEYDLRSAYAQFIDQGFNCAIFNEVYDNISSTMGISRDDAKVEYNRHLNSTRMADERRINFFKKQLQVPN